jgi:hypothetical protein
MLRRFLLLTSAAALLVFGLGAFEARAGYVTLPNTLDMLTADPANFTWVHNHNPKPPAENLRFSGFGYSITGQTLPASSVNVLPFTTTVETGVTFQAGWLATAGNVVDVDITYVVRAPKGQLLTDAYLSITGSLVGTGGTGIASVGETLTNTATGAAITTLTASLPGSPVDSATFAGVQSITVSKDMILYGGTVPGGFSSISIINQGFSSNGTIPEPTSMALLGIGMAGFFTYRRLFKRAATA